MSEKVKRVKPKIDHYEFCMTKYECWCLWSEDKRREEFFQKWQEQIDKNNSLKL